MSEFNESLYFRDLNRYPTLSQQEEEALLTIIRTGETEEIRKSALQMKGISDFIRRPNALT